MAVSSSVQPSPVQEYRAKRDELQESHPTEMDWAEDVMLSYTTYTRRHYGNGKFYCWAEVDVVNPETGKDLLLDPWPSSQYSRAALLVHLCLAKIRTPSLAIASGVRF